MYRGFNLKLEEYNSGYFDQGLFLFEQNSNQIKTKLNSFITNSGILNGSLMQSNWFPQIKADIFISHSHEDVKRAIGLAGWLYEKFKIKSFIDSSVWGYANDLLRTVDDRYCLQDDGVLYSYKKRNRSTSHIHMMLSTALNMMIDKTECVFFLNTPSSIATSGVINQTASPWLYAELSMTKLVRRIIPDRIRIINESYKRADGETFEKGDPHWSYNVDLSHLTDIDSSDLVEWHRLFTYLQGVPLDTLYNDNPIKIGR